MANKRDCFLSRLEALCPKPVLIVGRGVSGESVQKFFLGLGWKHKIDFCFYSDKPAESDFDDSKSATLKFKPRTLVVSPGYPLSTQWIQEYSKSSGAIVTSEINLASLILDKEIVIGITGSLGKSTTTSLLGHCLKQKDPEIFVGGNLGVPFLDYARGVLLESRLPAKYVVLEISSFQLENSWELGLDVAAITFLSSNHLERYRDLDHYYKTKFDIQKLLKPNGFLVANKQGGDLWNRARDFKFVWSDVEENGFRSLLPPKIPLLGEHNKQNIALVFKILEKLGVKDCSSRILTFKGLEHRIETVGEINGVKFVNDSKATALDSVKSAIEACLESCGPSAQVWLLLGGRDKNHPWASLEQTLENPQVKLILFGESSKKLEMIFSKSRGVFSNLLPALDFAFSQAHSGDCVLLSPGGTSLDEFKSFQDRGNFFKDWYKNQLSRIQ